MAGGKEYTLTFLIKAAADSSYEAAFSKAKQELNQFQQQINQNNSLLKDISGYEINKCHEDRKQIDADSEHDDHVIRSTEVIYRTE